MEQHTATPEQRRKPRGKPWPAGVSGNPSGAAGLSMRAAELFDRLAGDFGGAAALSASAIDSEMLRQAARLMARAARTRDADAAVRLTSEARRLVETLRRRKREPAVIPLRARLAAEAAEAG